MKKTGAKKKAASKKPASKKPASKRPASKKPASKKPASKKPASKKPASTKVASKKKPAPKVREKGAAKAPAQSAALDTGDASKLIEQRFREIGGWRGQTLERMRKLILEADPDVVEERKWIKPSNPHGVPTYSHAGLLFTLEVYKEYVKLTFAYGSKIPDPTGVFIASLLGLRRAVDIREGAIVDAEAFKALVKAAVALNLAKKS